MGDCALLARSGQVVDTYTGINNGNLWIVVGETHQLIYGDEVEEYFDLNENDSNVSALNAVKRWKV